MFRSRKDYSALEEPGWHLEIENQFLGKGNLDLPIERYQLKRIDRQFQPTK